MITPRHLSIRSWCGALAAWLAVSFLCIATTAAQEPQRSASDPVVEHVPKPIDAAEEPDRVAEAGDAGAEHDRQERIVTGGLLAVVGIAIIGGLLMIVTILWGGSLRKRTRIIPPPTSPQDELWYLKKPKPNSLPQADTDESQGNDTNGPS